MRSNNIIIITYPASFTLTIYKQFQHLIIIIIFKYKIINIKYNDILIVEKVSRLLIFCNTLLRY